MEGLAAAVWPSPLDVEQDVFDRLIGQELTPTHHHSCQLEGSEELLDFPSIVC